MKRINYLIVAMLMAFTMVGCQNFVTFEDLDKRDYATKDWVKEYVADQLKSVNKRIDELPTSSGLTDEEKEEIKADLEAYCLENCKGEKGDKGDKGDTGDATVDLADVKERLATVESKISKVEETLETYKNVLTDIDNLEKGLANKLDKSFVGNYESLAKALETVKVDLTNYVTSDKIKNWITKEDLGFESGDTIDNVKERLATVESKISKVESILEIENDVSNKLAELETTVNNKADASELTSLKETYESFIGTYENLESALGTIDLSAYLTSTDLGYNSKDEVKVDNVASSLENLKSRVDTLEGLLTVDNELGKVITNLNNSIKANADKLEGIETVKASLDELSETIATNKTELEGLIASKYSDIETIQDDVDNLKTRKIVYSDFADTVITELDKLYQTKGNYITSDYITEDLIKGLIGTYIKDTVKDANNTLKTEIASNYQTKGDYATKTDLANYLTSESQIIKDLTNGLATWNVKKGKYVDTEHSSGCAYYLINDSICIGYHNITMVDETYTFEDLMIKANQSSDCSCEVSNKRNINLNVVFE